MRALTVLLSEWRKLLAAFVDTAEAVVGRIGAKPRWLAVQKEHGGFAVFRASAGKVQSFGEVPGLGEKQRKTVEAAAMGGVELRLAPDQILDATFKMPAAALPFASKVVEHRLEKLTPWRPDKVLYGFDVAAKPGAGNQHDVFFAATSRDIAAAATARIREAMGVGVSAIGNAAEPLDRPPRIDLLGGSADLARHRRRRRIAAASAAALVLSLACFAGSQWLYLRAAGDQAALDARLAETRGKLVSRGGMDAGRQRDLALVQSKTPAGAAFLLIDGLSAAIPDNTVLDELEIKPDSVRLAGSSSDASALIGILETKTPLSDAEFAAPVTRQLDGRDRFDIVLARQVPSQDGRTP